MTERHQGARSDVVVLCTDPKFVLPCAFLIDQLAADPEGGRYDVVVVHDGLGKAEIDRLEHHLRRPVATIDFRAAAARLDGVRTTDLLSRATYMRLFLDDLLPSHYRRILYLDSDLYLESPAIAPMFDLELAGAPFAAAHDGSCAELLCLDAMPRMSHASHDRATRIAYREGLGIGADDLYCNAGVLLIDRQRWVEERISESALAFALSRPALCLNADQSAINAVAQHRWAELSPRYNFQGIHAMAGLDEQIRPVIRHFAGPYKPWNTELWGGRFTAAYRGWQGASGWPGAFPAGPAPALPERRPEPKPRGALAGLRERFFGTQNRRGGGSGGEDGAYMVGPKRRAIFRSAVLEVMARGRFIDLDPAEAQTLLAAART